MIKKSYIFKVSEDEIVGYECELYTYKQAYNKAYYHAKKYHEGSVEYLGIIE